MDSIKFESLSVLEKENFFEGLKPFLKTSARFGVPLVDSVDEYESLSIAEQENFFKTISKFNLALLLTVPSEENSKLKQKTLDHWFISKNSSKKRLLEKESKCNESTSENRDESKSKEKDVANSKDVASTGKQHSSNSPSEVNSKTGNDKCSSFDKFDAVKKSPEQADSLIASISLDKISSDQRKVLRQTSSENESEFSKISTTSNFPAIKCKSAKNCGVLSECNKVDAAQVRVDGVHENPAEVTDIIGNELNEASNLPKQLGKRHKRKTEAIGKNTRSQNMQKTLQSPTKKSTSKVENADHFYRKTRYRSKIRSDESIVDNSMGTDEQTSGPSKTKCLTKSIHGKSHKTIKLLTSTASIRGDETIKSSLEQDTFSMECEKSKRRAEACNTQGSEIPHNDSVKSLTDKESIETQSFLSIGANKSTESENASPISKNNKTSTQISKMRPKTSRMTKTASKLGKFSPECELPTEANTKVPVSVEDPIIIHIKKTGGTLMASKCVSNVHSRKAKDTETVVSADSTIVTNYSSEIKSNIDEASGTLLKQNKLTPQRRMSTSSTESCNSKESKIIIQNQVETFTDGVSFQPNIPSASNMNANIINEEIVISFNRTEDTDSPKRSVRLAKLKKTGKTSSKQGKFSAECELTTEANTKVPAIVEDPTKIQIKNIDETQMSPKCASNIHSNESKDTGAVLSVDSNSVTNYCPKIKLKNNKTASKTQLKGNKFSLKSEQSTSLSKSCNYEESTEIIMENQAELHTDDVNFQPVITSSSISANIVSKKNVSSNKNNTQSPIRSLRLANKASKLRSKCISNSNAGEQSMREIKATLKHNETESTSQFLKPSQNSVNISPKNSIKFGMPHKNIVSDDRNSKADGSSSSHPKLPETNKKDTFPAFFGKTKNTKKRFSRHAVKLESVNTKTLSPLKQSTNLQPLIELTEKPLSKQKETLNDSAENEKQILSSSNQSELSPKSNLSKQYKELNDEIDVCMELAKDSSKCKSQGSSSMLKNADTDESILLHCKMDKSLQSPKKKYEEHSDKSEVTKDSRLIKKAGKRNRKQVHKQACFINASNIDNAVELVNETEIEPLFETTSKMELKDIGNVGSSPSTIHLRHAEVTRSINFNHKNVEDEIDPALLKTKSRLTRSKINSKKTAIEIPSAEMVCENTLIMNQRSVDNSLSVKKSPKDKSKKLDVTDQNEEIVHNDDITNFVPLKKSSSKVCTKINKPEDLKISRSTKRKFSSDSGNETENKISLKKVKFSENTLPNDNINELSKEQSVSQNKNKELPRTRERKGSNSKAKCCFTPEKNKSEKVNKTKSREFLTSDRTDSGKEIGVKNSSENITLETDEPKNCLKGNSTEKENIIDVDTMLKPLLNKKKRLDKNNILRTKRSRLKKELIETISKEQERSLNDLGSSITQDEIQPDLSPIMQKKYKEYKKLQESCAAIRIDVNELFECQEIKDLINNPDIFTKDGIVFIGPCKLPATEKIVPIVYAHPSKTELCKSMDKMSITTMKNTDAS